MLKRPMTRKVVANARARKFYGAPRLDQLEPRTLLSTIGNFVWNDQNGNGLQDPGEPGVVGVTVRLFDASGTTQIGPDTATDSNGAYGFTGLNPGTYNVEFVLPAGFVFTTPNAGVDETLDSDAVLVPASSPAVGRAGPIVLPVGVETTNNDVDAGLINQPPTITSNGGGDTASVNVPENTTAVADVDATDPELSAITYSIVPRDDAALLTIDSSTGQLSFITAPNFENPTDANADNVYVVTVRATDAGGAFDEQVISATVTDVTTPASVGDRVWDDANGNGLQDSGELGVSGIMVNLLNAGGTQQIGTTTTDALGQYSFADVAAGDYVLEFVIPSGRDFTLQDQGADDAIDSDVNPGTGRTGVVTLTEGQNNTTVDAGAIAAPTGSIGDFVWNDVNANGIQDVGETGVANITVNLLDSSGTTQRDTTTTNGTGNYLFDNVAAGSYIVEFVLPVTLDFTSQDQGTDDTLDSDPNPATGKTRAITVGEGQDITSVDAGTVPAPLGSIGNFVWNDADRDGIQDQGESGVADVTVNLLNSAGAQLATAQTNPSGNYIFDNLAAGDYIVEFVVPGGQEFTNVDVGTDDAIDSDASRSTGRTGVITLGAGEDNPTVDAGLRALNQAPTITSNGGGDTATANVPENTTAVADVNATDPEAQPITFSVSSGADADKFDIDPDTGVLAFKTAPDFDNPTDANGDNTYVVVVRATDAEGGFDEQTLSAAVTNVDEPPAITSNGGGDTAAVSVPENTTTVTDVNADDPEGATVTYSISGGDDQSKFNIDQATGVLTFVTAPDFENPMDANQDNVYIVTVQASDGTLTDQQTLSVTVTNVVEPASVGDLVWHDLNLNGIQDTDEPGIDGATVRLLDSAGTTVLATTTTSGGGQYSFAPLAAGDYIVEFVLPTGYDVFTLKNRGANDSIDSDADRLTGRTGVISLGEGENDTTIDAGVGDCYTGTLGSRKAGLGQFTNDQVADLIVIRNGRLLLRQGQGNGSFAEGTELVEGVNDPKSLIVRDFNRDGISDVALINGGDKTISILHGDGDGALTLLPAVQIGFRPASVAAGDVNGDGFTDLIVTDPSGHKVGLALGQAGGTFAAERVLVYAKASSRLTVGDFNGDGLPDVAVLKPSIDSVLVRLKTQQGFGDPQTFKVGDNPTSIAAGDFDCDGDADLLVGNSRGRSVSLLRGNGNGGFAEAQSFAVAGGPRSVLIGDINGDGRPDIVGLGRKDVSVGLGAAGGGGGGGFTKAQGSPHHLTGPADQVMIGDLDGDGDLDLLALRPNGDTFARFGHGDGTFDDSPELGG